MPRNHYVTLSLSALLLSVLCGPAFATAIQYVDSLNGLRDAIHNAPATGASIVLAPGIYHQTRTIDIFNKNNISISGATNDFNDTVIQGPGINDRSLGINIKVQHSNNVTLSNFTLSDSYYHGVQIKSGSNGFVANHLRILDNGESGFKVASNPKAEIGYRYADNGVIKNSVIGFTDAGQRNVVEGIDIVAAKGWKVIGNKLYNIRKYNGGPAYAVFAKGNSQDTIFADNIVKDSFLGLSFGGGGTGKAFFRDGDTQYETRGGVIRNNLLYDLDDSGIYMNKAKDFQVAGNTILRNGKGAGSINVRYLESDGVISNNRITGSIRYRAGGTAEKFGNVKLPLDTPAPEPPSPPAHQVGEPAGWSSWSLLALASASIFWFAWRRQRHVVRLA